MLGVLLFMLVVVCVYVQCMDWDSLIVLVQVCVQKFFQLNGDKLFVDFVVLDYDQVCDIWFWFDWGIWCVEVLFFEVQYFYFGLYQIVLVCIYEIVFDGVVCYLFYCSEDFYFGYNMFDMKVWGDFGYVGFCVYYLLNLIVYKDELIVFLGVSYFCVLGVGQ